MTARVAFFSSDQIGLPVLERLYRGGVPGFELCGVVTGPDRRRGRGKLLQPNEVAEWAADRGIDLHQPQRPGDETVEWLRNRNTDTLLVIAYGHILHQKVLDAAPLGAWNLHGSLLPKFRGASPVETAIAAGEECTGVSLMRMVRKMDAGPVLATRVVPVDDLDTGPSLRIKVGEAAADLTTDVFHRIHEGTAALTEQDHSAASYCRKIVGEDRYLDFSASADVLARRIRALAGWPGSVIDAGDGIAIKVERPTVFPAMPGVAPGEVIGLLEAGLGIGTGNGTLVLGMLQKPGGKMLPAGDFLRGFPLSQGSRLKSQLMRDLIVPENPQDRPGAGFQM